MADRYFFKKQAIQREVKEIYMEVSIGASGAPTLASGNNAGIASITRNAAGDYDVVLSDTFNKYLSFNFTLEAAAAEDLTFQLGAKDPAATGGGTFSFFTNAGGTATDPSNGATIYCTIVARNSSVYP